MRVLPVAAWLAGAMAGPLHVPSNQLGLGLATAGDGIFELGGCARKCFEMFRAKTSFTFYHLPFTTFSKSEHQQSAN